MERRIRPFKIRETTYMNPKRRRGRRLGWVPLVAGGVLVLAALLAAGVYFGVISLWV